MDHKYIIYKTHRGFEIFIKCQNFLEYNSLAIFINKKQVINFINSQGIL